MSVLGCYGVSPDKATEDWMCSRCTENALEEVMFFRDGVWYIWQLGYKVNSHSVVGVGFLNYPVKRPQFRECLGANLLCFGTFKP